MSSDLLLAITATVQTTDDLRVLQRELEEIKGSIYSSGKNGLETVLKERVRLKTAETLSPALGSKPENTIEELLKELKELPILRLRIAFEPTRSTLEHLSKWLAQNTQQHWVMELIIDHEVTAGAVIEVNGLYRDFSLKEKMSQTVQQITQQLFKQITV